MWIQTTRETTSSVRLDLLCDECGALFNSDGWRDRRTYWRLATTAGWVRTARVPERHSCANC